MRVVVVGASVAGIAAAEGLRAAGFEGEIVLLGEERCAPYDRPPLSKQFLVGEKDVAEVALRKPGVFDELEIEYREDHRAVGLDLATRSLALSDRDPLEFDGLIVATGSRARRLPGCPEVTGAHVLRTLDDALAVREQLPRAQHVTVIGAGFIGLEAASCARALGKRVTVVDVAPEPMGRLLSTPVGRLFGDLHRAHRVEVRCGVPIEAVEVEGDARRVRLGGGEAIESDLVVIGIGAIPNDEWLEGSGVEIANGVVCDPGLRAAPRVYAAGDVARWRHPLFGSIRVEHWTTAVDHARVASANLAAELCGEQPAAVSDEVPYFWSDQHGIKIQMAGWSPEAELLSASVEDGRLLILLGREEKLVAALTWDWPRELARYRRAIAAGTGFEQAVAAAPGEQVRLSEVLGKLCSTNEDDAIETADLSN
jgi:NADPH-dependent 2,4-dienoyl-CoA reductase/sulfur reductase-like enzyme